jgi:hypothetical protein
VYFTELGEREKPSLHTRIPAGKLHRLSHSSILRLLKGAKQYEVNVPLKPSNVPSAEEYQVAPISDAEGLRWVYRERSLPLYSPDGERRLESSVEFVCLDDTSLRGAIRMANDTTLNDMLSSPMGEHLLKSLIESIKESFEEVSALAL